MPEGREDDAGPPRAAQEGLLLALPLGIHFLIMFLASFCVGKHQGADYAQSVTLCFMAAGNNFELAIAVEVDVFGRNSGQAFVGVVSALIEVPALIGLVNVAFRIRRRYFGKAAARPVALVPSSSK